ncbi:PDDEXK-like family protein [Pseudomonas farris]
MSDLFHAAAVLRAIHHRDPGFNLFSVLRTNSDEVYLHSRFLAFLLNPKASHGCGSALLKTLLEVLHIEDFDVETASVQAEFKDIDIFVRNAKSQAIIIENKIYHHDEDEQIYRYDQLIRRQGYTFITNLYLTLDGSEPSEQSSKGVKVDLISYETDIINWLERCVPLVARDAGLCESVFQYIELLKKLTSTDQGGIYMSELKKKVLEGDNLLLVADIKQAYKEALIDLQDQIWVRIRTYREATYPDMPKPEDTANRDAIRNYYSKSRGNREYGLYFDLGAMTGFVYIELNHRFYFGYGLPEEAKPSERKTLRKLSDSIPGSSGKSTEMFWCYPEINIDLVALPRADLVTLRDPVKQQAIAKDLVDGMYELWIKGREFTLNAR